MSDTLPNHAGGYGACGDAAGHAIAFTQDRRGYMHAVCAVGPTHVAIGASRAPLSFCGPEGGVQVGCDCVCAAISIVSAPRSALPMSHVTLRRTRLRGTHDSTYAPGEVAAIVQVLRPIVYWIPYKFKNRIDLSCTKWL